MIILFKKKSELLLRVMSSILMIFLGFFLLMVGGKVFDLALLLISAVFVWELLGFGVIKNQLKFLSTCLFVLSIALYTWLSPILSIVTLVIFLLIYRFFIRQNNYNQRAIYFIIIFLSFLSLAQIRYELGVPIASWVICCVISSDIGGYIIGRYFGGPKLWPLISPNKTWSGILGGWVFAGITTYIFTFFLEEIKHYYLIFAVLISISSQLGDLYESAIKRSSGIKDSSKFIPGHGGFLDRFDGMIGAFFFIYILNFFEIINWIYL